jgi:hypothetical protein
VDLFDVVRSCLRRWYVLLPLLLVTGAFSYHVYSSVKPAYYSNAVIGLTPPSTRNDANPIGGGEVPRNGLLDVGGANLIANIATIGLSGPAVADQVKAAGGAVYTVRMFPIPESFQQLPLIMIEVSAADAATALRTVELVVSQAEPTVLALQKQANVPEREVANSFVVSPPAVPIAGMPSRTRSTLVIFCAGSGIALVLAVVIDLIAVRIRARRKKSNHLDRDQTGTPEPGFTPAHGNGHSAVRTPAPEALYVQNKHVAEDVGPAAR